MTPLVLPWALGRLPLHPQAPSPPPSRPSLSTLRWRPRDLSPVSGGALPTPNMGGCCGTALRHPYLAHVGGCCGTALRHPYLANVGGCCGTALRHPYLAHVGGYCGTAPRHPHLPNLGGCCGIALRNRATAPTPFLPAPFPPRLARP